MRNFGWGLFSLFVAILALVLIVQDDYVSNENAVDYTVQMEALTLPAIAPAVPTATPEANVFDFARSATAIDGKGMLAHAGRLNCPHCTDANQYAAEFNWSNVTEQTARSGPITGQQLFVKPNGNRLIPKGAANLPLIV